MGWFRGRPGAAEEVARARQGGGAVAPPAAGGRGMQLG
jgi:hypothetical protein